MYNISMQFEVPQFIEIEDKIFGPFTWRQFLYLGGGGALAVVLFFTTHWVVFLLIGVPVAALAGALAFYPVNNRPFSFFVEAIYNYFRRQRIYFWKQKNPTVYRQQSFAPRTTIKNPALIQSTAKKDISSLARRLELENLQK